jgi:hypothetical protein
VKARIQVVAGAAAGRSIELEPGQSIVVGRGADVQLSVPQDTALSRRHLELALDAQHELHARDLQSKHGVFVNGTRIAAACKLAHGDRVQAGDTILSIALVLGAFAPTLAPPAATAVASPRAANLRAQGSIRCRCGALFSGAPQSGDDIVYLCPLCQDELATAPVLPAGFELERVLGRGAMGCVYLAREVATGELRAIKQILPKAAMSAQMRAMFAREAAVQSRLDHPHIVRVYGLVEPLPGSFSIVMEYIDGDSAESLLEGGRTISPGVAVAIGCQALDGLAHAHARQIVHRDVKEANLMLVERGGGFVVKVADFGLAKNFHESGASGITSEGMLGGTLAYMPREQLLDFKYVKPPADIYALGATLYRLLTGEYPRDYAEGDNWIRISLEQPIVPIRERRAGRGLPAALCAVIEKALEPEVERRFASAIEMRKALETT